ncbi:MAG: SDR family NAD(P)-dependent oxidoreductase [Gammaproteobacteria bacterium]|nr:SDR family NAD(P)-dependent oxidoreductase [Gammaproteobacteria bacterium]
MIQRNIVITGCSSGIGRRAAEMLSERGYRVLATARKTEDLEQLEKDGFEAQALDLGDPASVSGFAKEVLARTHGRVYGLFNNGAYGQPGAVEDLTRDVLLAQLQTNVLGWHDLTCRLLPSMRANGTGRIIQNSSLLGLVALHYRGAYVASKYAIEGLTDTLRLELAGSGVYVSLIEPGPVTSRFRENAYAAFKANIDPSKSAHRDIYTVVEERLAAEDDTTPFTLPADAVVKKVIHALEARRPRTHYYVTVPTYLLGYLKRILTARQLDHILHAISRTENRPVSK